MYKIFYHLSFITQGGVHLKNPDARSIYEFLVSSKSKFSRHGFARGLNHSLSSIVIMWVDKHDVKR